jgi:hypothetical protein
MYMPHGFDECSLRGLFSKVAINDTLQMIGITS